MDTWILTHIYLYKRKLIKMKIFDFKNPKHLRILREELYRAKSIMKSVLSESSEYNEDEIWSAMSPEDRKTAILDASDNSDSSLADKYMKDSVWNNIPQDLADRINLSSYQLANNDRNMGRVMLRGIESMKFEFRNDLEKKFAFEKLINSFCKNIGKTFNQLNVQDAIKLNRAVAALKEKFNPSPKHVPGGDASADYGKRSGNWTGD